MGELWDNIWFRLSIMLGLTALLLWLCYGLRQILIPLALAFIIAYIFHPVVDLLEERRMPRMITIAALLILILAGFAGALLIVIPRLIRQTTESVQSVHQNCPEIQRALQRIVVRFSDSPLAERFTSNLEAVFDTLQSYIPQMLQSMETVPASIVTRAFGVIGFIVNFLLFAVVSVYLLRDFNKITTKSNELIPLSHKKPTPAIMQKINANLRSFFRGQKIVCTFPAGISLVGLSIVGVPFALLIAIVGGYGQIVPYLGTAIAFAPATPLALIEFTGLFHPLAAALVFVVSQTLEGIVITPKVMGDKVGLHPVAIIPAILVFGKLPGFLGILVAVPLAAVPKVMLDEVLTRYRQSDLFSNRDT